MKLSMYSVYDKRSKVYNPPQSFSNEGVALRDYQTQFRKEGTMVNQYPEDYTICEVGVWDDQTGVTAPNKDPRIIAEVKELIGGTE